MHLNHLTDHLTPNQFQELLFWLWKNHLTPTPPNLKNWLKLNNLWTE